MLMLMLTLTLMASCMAMHLAVVSASPGLRGPVESTPIGCISPFLFRPAFFYQQRRTVPCIAVFIPTSDTRAGCKLRQTEVAFGPALLLVVFLAHANMSKPADT